MILFNAADASNMSSESNPAPVFSIWQQDTGRTHASGAGNFKPLWEEEVLTGSSFAAVDYSQNRLLVPEALVVNPRQAEPSGQSLPGASAVDTLSVIPEAIATGTASAGLQAEAHFSGSSDASLPGLDHVISAHTPASGSFKTEAEWNLELQAQYEKGLKAGQDQAQLAFQQGEAIERKKLNDLIAQMRVEMTQSASFFSGFERLSLHLAKQLVRGELTLSIDAVRRLLKGCLADVDQKANAVVHLSPDDVQLFRDQRVALPTGMILEADSLLLRGSVRVSLSDGAVEDLIEHRLDALANTVLGLDAKTAGLLRSINVDDQRGEPESMADLDSMSAHAIIPVPAWASQSESPLDQESTHDGTHRDTESRPNEQEAQPYDTFETAEGRFTPVDDELKMRLPTNEQAVYTPPSQELEGEWR
jgi:flagellar biosynthesis/type III secretory pathway protein FliH